MPLPEGISEEFYFFNKLWSPSTEGIYSIHAIGRDNNDRLVASIVQNVSVSDSVADLNVSIINPLKTLQLNSTELDFTFGGGGELTGITLKSGVNSLGSSYYSAPIVTITGAGSGAKPLPLSIIISVPTLMHSLLDSEWMKTAQVTIVTPKYLLRLPFTAYYPENARVLVCELIRIKMVP